MHIRTIVNRKKEVFEILLDDEGLELFNKYSWCVNNIGYLVSTYFEGTKCKAKMFARILLNIENKNLYADHMDGNKLNNQISNLRLVTHKQNLANRGKFKNSLSKYKGVRIDPRRKNIKYRASIRIEGKSVNLGAFNDEIEAAKAYDKAASDSFGVYARINFPIDIKV